MRSLAILLGAVTVACGPVASGGGSSEGAGTGTGSGTSHFATTDPSTTSTASTTSTTTAGNETTGATPSSEAEVDTGDLKLDHAPSDAGPIDCPEERVANASVDGTTPLGALDLPFGWYATGGGGKCPYGYKLEFSAAIPFDADTPDRLDLFLEFDWDPDTYPTGELPMYADHDHSGEHAVAEGTANITAVAGPDEPNPRLVGTFVVDDPAWALSGTFDVPWCDLLWSGACGA